MRWLLYALVLCAAIIPSAPQEFGWAEKGYIALFAFVVGCWTVRVLARGRLTWRKTRISLPILLLLCLCFGSVGWATVFGTSFQDWFRGLVPFLSLLLFFVAIDEMEDRRSAREMIAVLTIATGIIVIRSLSDVLPVIVGNLRAGTAGWAGIRQSLATNAFSVFVVGTPAMYMGLLLGRRRIRLLDAMLLLFFLTFLFLTFLSSGFIAFVFAVFLALILRRSRGWTLHSAFLRLLFVGAVLLTVSCAIWPSVPQFVLRVSQVQYLQKASLHEISRQGLIRGQEFVVAAKNFLESPLIGKGLGFQYEYYKLSIGEVVPRGYMHNLFAYFAMTLGVAGLFLIVRVIVSISREIRAIWRSSDEESARWVMALACFLLSAFVYSLQQSIFRSISFFLVVSLVLGALVALGKEVDKAGNR